MKLNEIINKLKIELLTDNSQKLSCEVNSVTVGDLLSNIISEGEENNIWVTTQRHLNIIAVAVLKNFSAIIICSRAMPDEKTIEKAKQENIVMLYSQDKPFNIIGKLYKLLIDSNEC